MQRIYILYINEQNKRKSETDNKTLLCFAILGYASTVRVGCMVYRMVCICIAQVKHRTATRINRLHGNCNGKENPIIYKFRHRFTNQITKIKKKNSKNQALNREIFFIFHFFTLRRLCV